MTTPDNSAPHDMFAESMLQAHGWRGLPYDATQTETAALELTGQRIAEMELKYKWWKKTEGQIGAVAIQEMTSLPELIVAEPTSSRVNLVVQRRANQPGSSYTTLYIGRSASAAETTDALALAVIEKHFVNMGRYDASIEHLSENFHTSLETPEASRLLAAILGGLAARHAKSTSSTSSLIY